MPVKQKLVGSICSGKLVFNENDYQTIEFNDIIQGICRLGEHFAELEKGQASNFGSLSEEVTQGGMFSNQLREDLKTFFRLNVSYLHIYVPIL